MASFCLFFIFVVLFLMGVPVAISLGLSSIGSFMFFGDLPLQMIAQKLFSNIAHFPLMAVPFFILAGVLMEKAGIAERLINFANSLVGWIPGGLGAAAILACMLFAAISGSSTATAVAIGGIAIPGLVSKGYTKTYAVGIMATAGGLGIVIPPSISMITYGFATETSVVKLFIAGVVPGVLLGGLLMIVAFSIATLRGYKADISFSLREVARTFRESIWGLLLPVIIIGGIYGIPEINLGPIHISGNAAFTPTEASIVAVIYAYLVGTFIYRKISLKNLMNLVATCSTRMAFLLFIVTNAMLFGFFLTSEQIPLKLTEIVLSYDFSPWMYLLMVNIILFFAGDFMDPMAVIMIFAPILLAPAKALGIDPIHLGVVFVLNLEMGCATPPIGMNLFMLSGITGMPLYDVIRASLPWLLVDVVVVLLVTYIPSISMCLIDLLF